MNSREKGFLLLTSMLGDPQRRPLSAPQLRTLAKRALLLGSSPPDSELCPADLVALGYGKAMAQRIVDLLADVPVLEYYLERGKQLDCVPVTRVSSDYPVILRKRICHNTNHAATCLQASFLRGSVRSPGITGHQHISLACCLISCRFGKPAVLLLQFPAANQRQCRFFQQGNISLRP